MVRAVRLVRSGATLRLEVWCACCGAVVALDLLQPYAVCACGADLEPDVGELVPCGTA